MHPPTPHKITIRRQDKTDYETVVAWTNIATSVPALVVPASASLTYTFMGAAEQLSSLLFVDHAVDIQVHDQIQDEISNEWYVVTEILTYYNPTTWELDHKQCHIERIPIQPAS